MKNYVSAIAALGAAFMMSASIPSAEAGPRHHYSGKHFSHGYGHHGYYRHHRRGYWRNGRWIALGVGAAIAAGAAGAYDRDCYWRHGYRYCD
jgi:hypothetical protein